MFPLIKDSFLFFIRSTLIYVCGRKTECNHMAIHVFLICIDCAHLADTRPAAYTQPSDASFSVYLMSLSSSPGSVQANCSVVSAAPQFLQLQGLQEVPSTPVTLTRHMNFPPNSTRDFPGCSPQTTSSCPQVHLLKILIIQSTAEHDIATDHCTTSNLTLFDTCKRLDVV